MIERDQHQRQLFTPTGDCPDLWHYLARETEKGRPIVLYGMGNGADKIIAACQARGIPVSDTFAGDGFVRGHSFHGKRVLSRTEARERYGADMIVLLAFGSSRPDVLETIRAAAGENELYIPDMPVSGEDLFTAEFVDARRAETDAARALFADEASVRTYDGLIAAKLSGRMDLLEAAASGADETWRILPADAIRAAIDLGAYTGDSLRELAAHAKDLEAALCVEPDPRTYCKLSAYAEEVSGSADGRNAPLTVKALHAAAWSEDTILSFHGSGNRNASLLPQAQSRARTEDVPAVSPDTAWENAFPGRRVDYIKYDVEGAEYEALLGSRKLIARDAPALLVSAYHAAADLWRLPLLVHELGPDYRLYLRRMAGVPAWDINLYAVKK